MKLDVVSPIFGFESIKEFEFEVIDEFFSYIKSGDIRFTLISVDKIREYDIAIDESYKNLLELDENSKADIYAIVVLQNPIENSLINFAAPIIINSKKALLAQVALDLDRYKEYGISEPISKYL